MGIGIPVLILEFLPFDWKVRLTPHYDVHFALANSRESEFRPKIERIHEFSELLKKPPPEDDPWVYSNSEKRMLHIHYVEISHRTGTPKLKSWRRSIPSKSYTRYLWSRARGKLGI